MIEPRRAACTAQSATQRGVLPRVLAGVWLALHVLVVAALPLADAQAQHVDEVVAHWEDAERSDCPTRYGADHCNLCHLVLAGRALPASAPASLAPVVRGADAPTCATLAAPRLAFLDGHTSRAPPLG